MDKLNGVFSINKFPGMGPPRNPGAGEFCHGPRLTAMTANAGKCGLGAYKPGAAHHEREPTRAELDHGGHERESPGIEVAEHVPFIPYGSASPRNG